MLDADCAAVLDVLAGGAVSVDVTAEVTVELPRVSVVLDTTTVALV